MWPFNRRERCRHNWYRSTNAWNVRPRGASIRIECTECGHWTVADVDSGSSFDVVDRASAAEEAVRKYGT